MKKNKIFIMCIIFLLTVFLSACSKSTTINESKEITEKHAKADDNNTFKVEKILYEGTNINLSCKQIMKDGIEFEVVNKTNKEIFVSCNIGLDGIDIPQWGDVNDWTIQAEETKICKSNGDIKNPEHSLMSGAEISFNNDGSEEDYQFNITNFNFMLEDADEYSLEFAMSELYATIAAFNPDFTYESVEKIVTQLLDTGEYVENNFNYKNYSISGLLLFVGTRLE